VPVLLPAFLVRGSLTSSNIKKLKSFPAPFD
jgi:hypothetical protein